MSTYTKILLHIVFSTKRREPFIKPEVKDRLYGYMGSIIRNEGGVLYDIGGTADHVHIQIQWHTDEALSVLMRKLKRNSSVWVHANLPRMRLFKWQRGYAAFSVSQSVSPKVAAYIQDQVEHHKTRGYREELMKLLRAHDVVFEPELLWKDDES